MLEPLQARLTEREGEFRTGEDRLRTLVQEETTRRDTLLRMSGAIEVLRELPSAEAREGGG